MQDPWSSAGDDGTAGYMDDASFKSSMDSIYGAGRWKQTGGWRSQQRENQLRAQGAQTTAPGVTSAHSFGTLNAPGARDITVNGVAPQVAAAQLQAARFPATQVLPEGGAGNQGAHLHIGMDPSINPPAGASADPWASVGASSPAPQRPGAVVRPQVDPELYRVILQEAGPNASPRAVAAIASEFVNRAAQTGGSYIDVINARDQYGPGFSSDTAEGKGWQRASQVPDNDPRLQRIASIADPYLTGRQQPLPYTNHWSPGAAAATNESRPSWADDTGTSIGGNLFYSHAMSGAKQPQADPWGLVGAGSPPVQRQAQADPWAMVGGTPRPAPPQPIKRGLLAEASHLGQAFLGGAESATAQALRGYGGIGDVIAQGMAAEAGGQGTMTDPLTGAAEPVPEAIRPSMAAIAQNRTPVASPAVGQLAAPIAAAGEATTPKDLGLAGRLAAGAGGFAPLIASGTVDPLLGISTFGASGYEQSHSEALAKGASEETAQEAGLAGGGVSMAAGALPIGHFVGPLIERVGGGVLARAAARTAAASAENAAQMGAMTAGSNVVAQKFYDPTRGTWQDVPQAMLSGAVAGGLIHGATEGAGGVKALFQGSAADKAAAQAEGMPAADARQAYADLTARQTAPGGPYGPPADASVDSIPTAPPPAYEAARAAEGAPLERMPDAIADVQTARAAPPQGPNLFQTIKSLGGIKSRDAGGTLDSDLMEAMGEKRGPPGMINNKTGLSAEQMTEALKERGWFGERDDAGTSANDLNELIDRHVRNGPVTLESLRDPATVEQNTTRQAELDRAGVGADDSAAVAAAKLASYRETVDQQHGPAMEALRDRAANLGVPHTEGMAYDQLLHDVVEREAIQGENTDGWAGDHDERDIDTVLTPEEHEWLSAAERGARGERGQAPGPKGPRGGPAPEPTPAEGHREPGGRPGGGGAEAQALPEGAQLAHVDPQAIANAWAKGYAPFADRYSDIETAAATGGHVVVPAPEFSKEVTGQPFEEHLRANSTFDNADGKDPWASAGEEPLEHAADTVEFPRGRHQRNMRISIGQDPNGFWTSNLDMNVKNAGWGTSSPDGWRSFSRDEALLRQLGHAEITLEDTSKHFKDTRPDAEALLTWIRAEKAKLEQGGTIDKDQLAAVKTALAAERAELEGRRGEEHARNAVKAEAERGRLQRSATLTPAEHTDLIAKAQADPRALKQGGSYFMDGAREELGVPNLGPPNEPAAAHHYEAGREFMREKRAELFTEDPTGMLAATAARHAANVIGRTQVRFAGKDMAENERRNLKAKLLKEERAEQKAKADEYDALGMTDAERASAYNRQTEADRETKRGWDFKTKFPPEIEKEGRSSVYDNGPTIEGQSGLHEETATSLFQDRHDRDAIDNALGANVDPENGKPLTAKRREALQAQAKALDEALEATLDAYQDHFGPVARDAFAAWVWRGKLTEAEAQHRAPSAQVKDTTPFDGSSLAAPATQQPSEKMDLGGEKVDQLLIPGAEQSARQAAQARGETLRPRVPQQGAGDLFAESHTPEPDLFSGPGAQGPPEPKGGNAALEPEAREAKAAKEGPKPGEGYGEKNKLFTAETRDAALKKLREISRRSNAGVDPELVHSGIMLAGYHVEAGARKFADYAKAMLQDLGEWSRPYLKMWYNAVRDYPGFSAEGMTPTHEVTDQAVEEAWRDVRDSGLGLEPGSQGTTAPDADGQEPVPAGPGAPQPGAGGAGAAAAGGGNGAQGGVGLPDRGAAPVGEGGALDLFAGSPGPLGRAAERGQPGGSDLAGDQGIQPERIPATEFATAADDAAHLEPVAPAAHPDAASVDAPAVPHELDEALPTLFPEQRADVAFAEERFAKDDGHGVLFTNGTGTGKTFAGGGIVKRFHDAGKGDILVIAPSQGILDHWVATMENLKVPFDVLPDTSGPGELGKPTGTTYANLANNRSLADRKWDLVVADEAHNLSSNKDGGETTNLTNFRAITHHPDRLQEKARMQLREVVDRVDAQRETAGKDPVRVRQWEDAANALDAEVRQRAALLAAEPRSKAVFLSATPFAYDKSIDYAHGYLFDYGAEPGRTGYNVGDARDQFMMRHFGYRMRYGKLTKPDSAVESDVMERQFHEWLRRTGSLSGRVLTVDQDYDRKFMLTPDAMGTKIDQALDFLHTADDHRFSPLADAVRKRFDYLARARLLEAMKAKAAIPAIEKHIALGRKVVIFHNYNEGGGFAPFEYGSEMEASARTDQKTMKVVPIKTLHDEFMARNPYVTDIDEHVSALGSPLEQLQAHFPDALVYNGTVPRAQRAKAIQQFNQDGGRHNLIIVQSEAGQAGISLHDTTGQHQRATLNLGMPGRPTAAIQQEGRTYRIGQASDAIFRYMNTGTNWERSAFAQTIAQRAGTAENLALGDQARTMRESFINAFLDSAPNPPARGEGKGGKLADRALAKAMTAFQKAKSFYFAEGKKAGGRANREGVDYFPTPEPLGLKMVEWADARSGEHMLEPSAGHGAIARFFPETTSRTLVEPSAELASRAELSSPGARVINQRFEDLHAVNKFHAIVMNPPFGHAGATAIEHLQKAALHLADGGRIVALIPHGATDAKFERLMESDAFKNIYKAADINLPTSTFERAGTKISAHVVVLERVNDPAAPKPQEVQRDFSNADDIKQFFDRIEDSSIPDRLAPRSADLDPQPAQRIEVSRAAKPATSFETGQTIHGKTGEDVYVAAPRLRVSSDDYKATLALAKENNGLYSSFRGKGAIPGFQFKTEADRQAFLDAAQASRAEDIRGEGATYQRAVPLYSAVQRTVERSPQKTASAEQWRSMLENAPGVKKEELEWTGVNDWLDMFKGQKVTKEAVQAFLSEHGVHVEEHVLGAGAGDPEIERRTAELHQQAVDTYRERLEAERESTTGRTLSDDEIDEQAFQAADDRMDDFMRRAEQEAGSQYSNWTLPGGQDYRELLFTLPQEANPPATHWTMPGVMAHVRFDTRTAPDGKKVLFIEEVQSDWHQKGRDQGYAQKVDPAERMRLSEAYAAARTKMHQASDQELEAAKHLLRTVGVPEGQIGEPDPDFSSAQRQREQFARRLSGRILRDRDFERWTEEHPHEKAAWAAAHLETVNARLAEEEARQAFANAQASHGIALAPFKSSWPALVMRRMIVWAADHGMDRVAWTTGDQQAERYSLEKHLGGVRLHDNSSGGIGQSSLEGPFQGGVLELLDPSGRQIYRDHVRDRAAIEAAIGRELTERLFAAEPRHSRHAGLGVRERALSGLDVRTGGEGMRAFYDRNLVNITNDIIKQYGEKVGDKAISLEGDQRRLPQRIAVARERYPALAEMSRSELDAHFDRLRDRIMENPTAVGPEHPLRLEQRAASLLLDAHDNPDLYADRSKQPGFEVTDRMREAATQGLPLFSRPPDRIEPAATARRPLAEGVLPTDTPETARLIKEVHDIVGRIAPGATPKAYASLKEIATGAPISGMFVRDGDKNLIAWALDSENRPWMARHEGVHYLRQLKFFKPAEWSAMVSTATGEGWLERYNIGRRYPDLSPEKQMEEAVAERYGDWGAGVGDVRDLPTFVRALFERIQKALGAIADATRQALGRSVTAEDVFRRIESGEVGDRTPGAPEPAGGGVSFARPPAEERETRSFINRVLGEGVDNVGRKISRAAARYLPDPLIELGEHVRMGLNPMAAGSKRAQATAKDFANAMRAHTWNWGRIDGWLEKAFTRDEREAMWRAADEESVLRQLGAEVQPGQGLSRLAPAQRAAVDELQARANDAFGEAQQLGMTKAEGLPSYVPRLVIEMTAEGGARRVGARERVSTPEGTGRNLTTTTGNLRQRKHLTLEDTEAAAREAFGENAAVITDIRALAYATGKLEQAIAGRRLINTIKEMGKSTGEELVQEGGRTQDGAFTLDHPAMKVWGPKLVVEHETGKLSTIRDPSTGGVVMEAKPLYVSNEFEGPLRAVLTKPPGMLEKGLMSLKGKVMSVIMYSPLMHNAVIWGKAISADPKGVLFFDVYREGYRAKNDPETMREALQAGVDPIGRRYFNQDVTALMEQPKIAAGRSWTAQLLGSPVGWVNKGAGTAVKETIDKLGDLWHNTFLWDRVADLQMGLYTRLRDSFIRHGLDPQSSQRVAAHFANRYAGALPIEAMSKMARTTANLMLFSRSFTMTNIGAWKDAVAGLPTDVQAQIERDAGLKGLQHAQGSARGKAISLIVLDIALAHMGLLLAAGAVYGIHQALGAPQPFHPEWDNEPGKQDRFLIGYGADGTALYGRLPTGKVAEDLVTWVTDPLGTEQRKLSPFAKFAFELQSNDKGFGRKLYDPYDSTAAGDLRNLSRVVLGADISNLHSPDDFAGGLLGAVAPVGVVQGVAHLGSKNRQEGNTALLQTALPLFGITVSKGAPGGPASGDIYRALDEQTFRLNEAMPGIREQIRQGDLQGARARLTGLGIPPARQAYLIRAAKQPGVRMTGRQLLKFRSAATPDQQAQFQQDLQDQRDRQAAP